jgi:hypothetical protein
MPWFRGACDREVPSGEAALRAAAEAAAVARGAPPAFPPGAAVSCHDGEVAILNMEGLAPGVAYDGGIGALVEILGKANPGGAPCAVGAADGWCFSIPSVTLRQIDAYYDGAEAGTELWAATRCLRGMTDAIARTCPDYFYDLNCMNIYLDGNKKGARLAL